MQFSPATILDTLDTQYNDFHLLAPQVYTLKERHSFHHLVTNGKVGQPPRQLGSTVFRRPPPAFTVKNRHLFRRMPTLCTGAG